MSGIIGKLIKGWAETRYEWYLYQYGTKKYAKLTQELSKRLKVDIKAFTDDELWCRGLRTERGIKMTVGLRKRIKGELMGMDLRPRKRAVKRPDVRERERDGLRRLEEAGRLMGYLLIENQYGLVMFQREMGFMIIAGKVWVYVYKTGHSFSFVEQMSQIGYFHLNGDVEQRLREAMNGQMRYRIQEHSMRRKRFLSRVNVRKERIGQKRKTT